jgi:hypothetical protein
VIPCRFADSLTLASSAASNLTLTRTFFAKVSPPAMACWLNLGVKAVGFGASGRRTETVAAPAVIRDDLASITTLSGRPALSREKAAAIAAANDRFMFSPRWRGVAILVTKSCDAGGIENTEPTRMALSVCRSLQSLRRRHSENSRNRVVKDAAKH